jgi:predicted acylesterase/phospholipase RssA/CRP-like cAMP-binding protein
MFIVASGCLQATVPERGGHERFLSFLGRGDHFGEMALLAHSSRAANITAVHKSELLLLDQHAFHQLLDELPQIGKNLVQTMGFRLKETLLGRRHELAARVVTLVHATPRAARLAPILADSLARSGLQTILLERGTERPLDGPYRTLPLEMPQGMDESPAQRWQTLLEDHDRILVNVSLADFGRLPEYIDHSDATLWLVEPQHEAACREAYVRLRNESSLVVAKTRVVWVLEEGTFVAPRWHSDWDSDNPNFKIEVSDRPGPPSRRQTQGIDRLLRHLLGVRIGLALGGGGARGLAHLGVLRALDRARINFDMMAGTSSGAMMGIGYASGYEPDFGVIHWARGVTPPRWLQMLPSGNRWYLRTILRSGVCDRRLRAYLFDWTLEQLQIPFYAMTVDLVTGSQVIREKGDAVHAMLESLNLPVVSVPILRDGMALVDGGVLNNLPADVLTRKGADFVVGVNVAAEISRQFAGNQPGMPTQRMKRPGLMATLVRIFETQLHELNAIGARAVDLLIEPPTARFDFADFTRSAELAEVGEAAAEAAIPRLKAMLAELHTRLSSGATSL